VIFHKTRYNYDRQSGLIKVKLNNRGSLLLEALVMFILLVIFFLVVWRSVDGYLQRERTTLFHDDVATLYQGYYVQEVLLRYTSIQTGGASWVVPGTHGYGRVIGVDSGIPGFFRAGANTTDFNNIMGRLNMHQIFLTNNISGLRNCARNPNAAGNCQRTFMDEEMRAFIRGIDRSDNGIYLIITFRRNHQGTPCTGTEACFSHFTWIRM